MWNEVVEGQITRFLAMFQSRSHRCRRTDPIGAADRPAHRLAGRRDLRLLGRRAVAGGGDRGGAGRRSSTRTTPATRCSVTDARRAPAQPLRPSRRAAGAFGGTPVPPPPLFHVPPRRRSGRRAPPATSVSIGYSRGFAVEYTLGCRVGHVAALHGRAARSTTRSGAQIATQNVVILPVAYPGGVGNEGAEAQLVGQGRRDRASRAGTCHGRGRGRGRTSPSRWSCARRRRSRSGWPPGPPGSSCPTSPTRSTSVGRSARDSYAAAGGSSAVILAGRRRGGR